jgi:hypothetical protein
LTSRATALPTSPRSLISTRQEAAADQGLDLVLEQLDRHDTRAFRPAPAPAPAPAAGGLGGFSSVPPICHGTGRGWSGVGFVGLMTFRL